MNSPHNESLILLDIRGLLIRRYSVQPNSDGVDGSDGKRYPAWYRGVSAALTEDILPLLEIVPPRRVICCWDGGNEYRKNLYPAYKTGRAKKDREQCKEAKQQWRTLFDQFTRLTSYLGIKHVKVDGQEADDLIALFCRQMPDRTLMVRTGDADLIQLAGDYGNVLVDFFGPQGPSTSYSSTEGFAEKEHKGCPINLIRLKKSMVGDVSDSYNGVMGFGEKAWDKLLAAYGADGMLQLEQCVKDTDFTVLESAIAATNDKLLAKLLSQKDEWKNGYSLASFKPDCCYYVRNKEKVVKPEWTVRLPLREKFAELLSSIGGDDLLPQFEKHLAREVLLEAEEVRTLKALGQEIVSAPLVAYDFETQDTLQHPAFELASKGRATSYVDVLSQSVAGMSVCVGDNLQDVCYIPLQHKDTDNVSVEWIKYLLKCCAANPAAVVQNANFELSVSRTDLGLILPAPLDTAITQSYVDENQPAHLKLMSEATYHYKQTTYKEVTQGRGMFELTAEEVLGYGCDDSLITANLLDLHRLILQLEGTWDFYLANEVAPAVDDVVTFISGTKIDFDYMARLQKEDADLEKQKIKEIRALLQQNAMVKTAEEQASHANTLLEEEWKTKGLKVKEKGENEESAKRYLWEACWAASVYRPYIFIKKELSFIPSAKQLNHVAAFLGDVTPLETDSKSGINDWLHINQEVLNSTELGHEFCQALGPASTRIKVKAKRTGEKYERLENACLRILREVAQVEDGETSEGTELNFGSPKQMMCLLYGILGLSVRRRSKVDKGSFRDINNLDGAPATGNKAIASALVFDDLGGTWKEEVLKNYMEVNACMQNNSLYYTPYPLWKHPRDGLLHPQFKNCGTVTRRPTGTSPNDLQVSSKGEAKIRKAYLPWQEDHCYVCHDFSGQELRLTASESRDPVMMDAYIGEVQKDIHSVTSTGIAQFILPRLGLKEYEKKVLPYDEFISGLRSEKLGKAFKVVRNAYAKQTNFLINYGGGARSLAENLLIEYELANKILEGTFELYARLGPWQKEVARYGRVHGYVKTAYGTRKHLPNDIWSEDGWLKSRAERQAVNQTIQGAAADMLKIVRMEMHKRKMYERYQLKSVKPIYDELATSVPIAAAPEYSEEMAEIMTLTPPGHPIPMQAEVSVGLKSWGDKKEVTAGTSAAAVKEFILSEQGA